MLPTTYRVCWEIALRGKSLSLKAPRKSRKAAPEKVNEVGDLSEEDLSGFDQPSRRQSAGSSDSDGPGDIPSSPFTPEYGGNPGQPRAMSNKLLGQISVDAIQRGLGNRRLARLFRQVASAPANATSTSPIPASPTAPSIATAHSPSVSRRDNWQSVGSTASFIPATKSVLKVQRLSVDDVIPDAILNPIKSLVSQVTGFGTGVTSKSETAVSGNQAEAETSADKVDAETTESVRTEQSEGETAEIGMQAKSTDAAASAESAKSAGNTQAVEIHSAVPVAEHATDPVKSVD